MQHLLALTLIPQLTAKQLKSLLQKHSAEDLFSMTKSDLMQVLDRNTTAIECILGKTTMERAEKEIKFAQRHHIKILPFDHADYPARLNDPSCEDTPVLLYAIGNTDLNPKHSIAIVGTRHATDYGTEATEHIIAQLPSDDTLIVSGLALGIDSAAHSAAQRLNRDNVGVVAHGLDQIYPQQNRMLAHRMIESKGAIVTEYPSETGIRPTQFPARNRIIAAMADVTIVVEAAAKGGALITANMANSYHRHVFAIPGRTTDIYSQGCNALIGKGKAHILDSIESLCELLCIKSNGIQTEMFSELPADDKAIIDLLREKGPLDIETISSEMGITLSQLSSKMLTLEFSNQVKCLPGGKYKAI